MRLRRRNPIADPLKTQLARAIRDALGECSLEQGMNALDLDAGDVSRLRNDRLDQFSIARLIHLMVRLGYDVEFRFTPRPPARAVRQGPITAVTMLDRPDATIRSTGTP
jgi:predicted XRE-type DNA-binding protein